jgi:hypothetical protein
MRCLSIRLEVTFIRCHFVSAIVGSAVMTWTTFWMSALSSSRTEEVVVWGSLETNCVLVQEDFSTVCFLPVRQSTTSTKMCLCPFVLCKMQTTDTTQHSEDTYNDAAYKYYVANAEQRWTVRSPLHYLDCTLMVLAFNRERWHPSEFLISYIQTGFYTIKVVFFIFFCTLDPFSSFLSIRCLRPTLKSLSFDSNISVHDAVSRRCHERAYSPREMKTHLIMKPKNYMGVLT